MGFTPFHVDMSRNARDSWEGWLLARLQSLNVFNGKLGSGPREMHLTYRRCLLSTMVLTLRGNMAHMELHWVNAGSTWDSTIRNVYQVAKCVLPPAILWSAEIKVSYYTWRIWINWLREAPRAFQTLHLRNRGTHWRAKALVFASWWNSNVMPL